MPIGGLTTRGPRNLLRQIREAMAGAAPAQDRLDTVVRIIAQSMVAEVCSIYLRRASGELELFATQGLKPEAVHSTRLRPGEGLVGEVARTAEPISLSDAPAHPSFAYRPETGEDPYHAFLGAPLLRGGRAIGVLVVQNRSERRYDEEEVEDIQTIAMVLAETVASGELLAQDELRDIEVAPHRPERLKGQRFAEGLAYGHVVLHEAPVPPENLLAENPQVEEIRLREALIGLKANIDTMLEGGPGKLAGQSFEVLETYRMFADDRGWNRSLEEAVRTGLTAEAAVDRVRNEHRARFATARDPYIRERLHDFEDLANRLLRLLAGDRPVTFRTLDIGGDKVLPYLETEREENPAMGRRAIRLGLDRPGLLRLQLRALLTAAAGRELRVMFPMIATVDEFRAARELVDVECAWARRRGRALPALLRIGAMIECPSLLWHLDALLPLTDFVSIGTNDLLQYMFAADRTNPLVAERYDPLSPPALRALAEIQKKCADTGTPVSVCGELAGRPLEAFALLTLGYTRLSAPAGGVGPVKRMILSADLPAARRGMANLLGSSSGSIRGELESLARKLNITI